MKEYLRSSENNNNEKKLVEENERANHRHPSYSSPIYLLSYVFRAEVLWNFYVWTIRADISWSLIVWEQHINAIVTPATSSRTCMHEWDLINVPKLTQSIHPAWSFCGQSWVASQNGFHWINFGRVEVTRPSSFGRLALFTDCKVCWLVGRLDQIVSETNKLFVSARMFPWCTVVTSLSSPGKIPAIPAVVYVRIPDQMPTSAGLDTGPRTPLCCKHQV